MDRNLAAYSNEIKECFLVKTSRQGDHEPKRDAADPGEKRVVRLDPTDTNGPCAIMMDETSLVQKIPTNSVGTT